MVGLHVCACDYTYLLAEVASCFFTSNTYCYLPTSPSRLKDVHFVHHWEEPVCLRLCTWLACLCVETMQYQHQHINTLYNHGLSSCALLTKFPTTFVLQHRHPLNHPVRTQCIFLCKFSCMTHVTKQHTYFRGKIVGTAITGYYTNLPPFCIAISITVRLGK